MTAPFERDPAIRMRDRWGVLFLRGFATFGLAVIGVIGGQPFFGIGFAVGLLIADCVPWPRREDYEQDPDDPFKLQS